MTDLKEEITLDIRLTWYSHVHADTINLKETLFLTEDKEDTVQYKWRVTEDKWSWQTSLDTFVRPNHHSYTYTHLVEALTLHSSAHTLSQDHTYPVYISGEVAPPASDFRELWFTLTGAPPALKERLFPKFFDSEMGKDYALSEETRDPEHL